MTDVVVVEEAAEAEHVGPETTVLEALLDSAELAHIEEVVTAELDKWRLEPRIGPHLVCLLHGIQALRHDLPGLLPPPVVEDHPLTIEEARKAKELQEGTSHE